MQKPIRPVPKFDWFIPIDGDGNHIGTEVAERPPTFDYLREVVQTAERNGFYSMDNGYRPCGSDHKNSFFDSCSSRLY